ncbi:hypothetical protein HPB50_003358 [Hyalomma asiaticum]|uniref:Uncharacterized protein n=1 Tax=Hyalomma asiaticum TaxID=266040 RepID=A0ACB7RSC6_HYAAI|nr:hypothetical protein HPB50_003358 [Hyalomma asiaticum]
MKDQIQAYHAKPDLSNDIPIEMPALQEPQEGIQRSCSSPADPNTSTALQTPPKEDTPKVRQPEVEEENGQSPQTPQEQGSAPKTTLQNNENALPGDHIADRATEAASGSKEQAGEASSTEKAGKKGQRTEAESDRAAANGRPNINSQKARRQESKKAAPDSTPEILIIGDGNVARIAGALRRIWDNTVHVEQRFERKATADRLQHLLRRHNDRKSRGAGLVVIHAGVQDVLNGSQPGDIAQAIRECGPIYTVAGASKEQRQAQPHISREVRTKCHRPGNANRNSATLGDEIRGSQHAPQGVQWQHPGPPSADILDEHGASADPMHTALPAEGAPSSTDSGTAQTTASTDRPDVMVSPPLMSPRSPGRCAGVPSTRAEFSSADMGAAPGHCPPYNDPRANTQSQRKPRALSNGWRHDPPAVDAQFAVATPDVAIANPPMISKLHRRHRRRRITTNVNVGFLNLHGARKAAKWAELYATLNMENISLYGVAETHIRELEEPPVDPEWQWAGCNRTGDCRKGGGVGVLWRNNAAWVPMKGPCDEHIWVTGSESVLFGVVYLTVASGPHDGNDKVLQCIVEDVKRWGADREVLLMGDFNGHIPATDGYLDYNGKLLRCAEQLSLEIVNLRTDCEGCFTWCARSSCSTIDYALATAKLAARIAQVHIDEDGQFGLGSDHNRIRLSFSRGGREVSREGRQDFENCLQRRKSHSYSEFVCALDAVMRTRMVQERRPGHRPQNSWWDREVEVAWKERGHANREHRRTVKGLDTEVCAEKWAVYLDHKHKVQALVQCKIADYNLRLIQSIRQEGRSAAHKFWTYVRSLDRAALPPPPLVDAATGQPVTEPCEYITQHFSRIFGASDPTTTTPLTEEEAVSPNTGQSPSQEEPPWTFSRLTVERALKRVRARTATGPDGMPARVLKCLGKDSREQLAEILTAIIEGGPIPKEWHEGKVILIPKRGGDARNIEDYRPITVTSVMYRLFAGVIKAWLNDLVLMAESHQELQSLLDICQTEIVSLGLRFNIKKSAVVRLAGGSTDAAALTLGGESLAARNEYSYLGVTLCVDAAKYSLHETKIRQAALQAQRILRRRCLWGWNRFQMIRDLWKMVHVPGLTFGNAVVCISSTTREWLERKQREVGRAALGGHGRVANEAGPYAVGRIEFEDGRCSSRNQLPYSASGNIITLIEVFATHYG